MLPFCDTGTMSLHLAEISLAVAPDAHAVVLMDQAGWSVSGDYDYPVGETGSLKLHADYGWRAKRFSTALALGAQQRVGLTQAQIDAGNQALQNTVRINFCGVLNARIGFQFNNPDLEIAAYVQNATKKKYITRLLALEATPFGLTSYLAGDPRTYGLSATFKF